MKNSKSTIQQIFKKCDIFGQYIHLYIQGQEQYRTTIGGVCTIWLIILGVFFTIYFSLDLVYKQNPKIIAYQTLVNHKTQLTNDTFFLAYDILFLNYTKFILAKDFFQMKIYTSKESYLLPTINDTEELQQMPCDTSLFKDFNITKSLYNQLKTFTCPNLNNIYLSGDPFHTLVRKSLWLDFSVKLKV